MGTVLSKMEMLNKALDILPATEEDIFHREHINMKKLKSYPHHFQSRKDDKWTFGESPMRGDIRQDIEVVIRTISEYLQGAKTKPTNTP